MNKLAKASIAGAAGIILLMGGAGTLAYWNGSAALGTAQTVNAGQLSVVAASSPAATWTSSFNGGTASTVNLSTFKAVPGDTIVYTGTYTVTATGNDLYFTISPTAGAVSGTGTANAALAAALQASASYTVSGSNITPSGSANTYKVATSGTTTVTVTETINWPFGTTADNSAQNGSVSLAAGAVTLTQVTTP